MIEMTLNTHNTEKLDKQEAMLRVLEWKYQFHIEQANRTQQQIEQMRREIYDRQQRTLQTM